jgi:hypothetical protein
MSKGDSSEDEGCLGRRFRWSARRLKQRAQASPSLEVAYVSSHAVRPELSYRIPDVLPPHVDNTVLHLNPLAIDETNKMKTVLIYVRGHVARNVTQLEPDRQLELRTRNAHGTPSDEPGISGQRADRVVNHDSALLRHGILWEVHGDLATLNATCTTLRSDGELI